MRFERFLLDFFALLVCFVAIVTCLLLILVDYLAWGSSLPSCDATALALETSARDNSLQRTDGFTEHMKVLLLGASSCMLHSEGARLPGA